MYRLTLVTVAAVWIALVGCSTTAATTAPAAPTTPSSTAASAPSGTTSCRYTTTSNPARPVDPPNGDAVSAVGTVVVTVTTNQGPVRITMDRSKTPCTVASFLSLVQQKYYDNTQCHRLADSGLFMLQCGDPTGTGRGGPGYVFWDETYPSDTFSAGTVAMANAGPNTNGSQFFFVYQDSDLPPRYTVFGRLDAESVGVIARIAAEGQDGSGSDGTGKPNNEARILSVSVG